MNTKLKEIFSQVQAEEELKENTRIFLAEKSKRYTEPRTKKFRYFVPAAGCICLLLLFFCGHWLYFTPTTEISIDINPSVELRINRFDRVISVNGLNEDGQELLKTLPLQFKKYTVAMEQILNSDRIAALLSADEMMMITVTGSDGTQSSKILSDVEACTAEQENMHCCFASPEEVASAHEMGLSYGKYRAFLEVQRLDPDITPEMIQQMTMREIREYLESLSGDNTKENTSSENNGSGTHGCGNGHGEGHGNGKRKNQCE